MTWYVSDPAHTIEVIYRDDDKIMRLDMLDDRPGRDNTVQRTIERHGRTWTAAAWRYHDGP